MAYTSGVSGILTCTTIWVGKAQNRPSTRQRWCGWATAVIQAAKKNLGGLLDFTVGTQGGANATNILGTSADTHRGSGHGLIQTGPRPQGLEADD